MLYGEPPDRHTSVPYRGAYMSLFKALSAGLRSLPRELRLFIAATFAMGFALAMVEAVFNNYINARFALSGFERSFMELPREFGGFVVVFVSALLWFLCSRRLGALAMVMCMVGAFLVGFASPAYPVMVAWLFIYSMGQHLTIPITSTIGMDLAKEGRVGRRLGQLNSVQNASALSAQALVFFGFALLGFGFRHAFAMAAFGFAAAAVLLFTMKPDKTQRPKTHLKLRKEYSLYYVLAVLYGSRKQIFLTFAPWVLVTIFNQPTQRMALIFMGSTAIGIVFQPFLGRAVDRLGERFVLVGEAVLLVFVCLGYGFSKSLMAEHAAFIATCVCFFLDRMLMSVNMARTTYMRKIALDPSHVQPALTSSVTIDHIFSITIALVGGTIWKLFGFQYVFLLGALIAVGNFAAALRIRIPEARTVSAVAPS